MQLHAPHSGHIALAAIPRRSYPHAGQQPRAMRRRRCGPNRRHPARHPTNVPYTTTAYNAVFTTKPRHRGPTGMGGPTKKRSAAPRCAHDAGGYPAGTSTVHVTLRCSCSRLRIGTPMRTRYADTCKSGATLTLASPSAVTTARIRCVVASTRKSCTLPTCGAGQSNEASGHDPSGAT